MVEPDAPISTRQQRRADCFRLIGAFVGAWKCAFVDLALVFLEAWDVSVTEYGQTVGAQGRAV